MLTAPVLTFASACFQSASRLLYEFCVKVLYSLYVSTVHEAKIHTIRLYNLLPEVDRSAATNSKRVLVPTEVHLLQMRIISLTQAPRCPTPANPL